eukprot:scaffold15089_cov168-Amphora_coffeaeformis.AAC.1
MLSSRQSSRGCQRLSQQGDLGCLPLALVRDPRRMMRRGVGCEDEQRSVVRFSTQFAVDSQESKFQLTARQFWAIVIMTFPSGPTSKFQILHLTLRPLRRREESEANRLLRR